MVSFEDIPNIRRLLRYIQKTREIIDASQHGTTSIGLTYQFEGETQEISGMIPVDSILAEVRNVARREIAGWLTELNALGINFSEEKK